MDLLELTALGRLFLVMLSGEPLLTQVTGEVTSIPIQLF